MSIKTYQKRVVCFVDILGFKDLIYETTIGKEKIEFICNCLDIMKEYVYDKEFVELQNIDYQFTHFSDCFIVSYEYTIESQTFSTLLSLVWMQSILAGRGILCRGGIAIGHAVHTPNYVFGSAVIEAYKLEQKSVYPRIILNDEVLITAGKHRIPSHSKEFELDFIHSLIKKDNDGYYYVDYLSACSSEFDDIYDYPLFLYDICKLIEKNLKNNDRRVVDKYEWMRCKYNHIIDNIQRNILTYDGNDYELIELYSKLYRIS